MGVVNASSIKLVCFGQDTIIIDAAIHRFHGRLSRLPNYATDYKINPMNHTLQAIETIEVHISSDDVKLTHSVNESYTISINEYSSLVVIESENVFGALYALETLGQLLEFGWLDGEGDDAVYVIRNIPIGIEDFPRYEYRGLLIDTSRHFLPLDLILANLDAMLMNKINVLHWHMTDSQSFPYLIESMPELAVKGAYHPKMVYTRKDIQRVIHEAYLRGIRVIPEVDMPGHTQSIAASRPDLMSCCPHPSDPLDPTNPKVYDFIRDIYQDLRNVFVDDFVHVGGDEVDLSCWDNSKDIVHWRQQHNISSSVGLFELFETQLLEIVEKVGRTPIVWQEVFNLNLTLTATTIIDVWKGFDTKTMSDATRRGFKVILSGCWYLDHLTLDWQNFYSCNPSNFTGRTDLLLGGHASMWGEHVDASNFISRIYPRVSAMAERLWTGDISIAKENVRQRISDFRCRMVQQGFAAQPIGPGFCAHEVPYQSCKTGDRIPSTTLQLEL
ncbi:unnamed protein product [Cylindrotheca closterium]|uniref:Beta-hexosaminidase n=1 Tax=Cylindrotheca closterium TaxID=2856 RepID=A0AAD2PVZ5_9STRA|nr:unnamed protein product [Cylindrotheca closterium]